MFWLILTSQWKAVTFGVIAATMAAYLSFRFGVGSMTNDSLINFLIVVRLIVPVILVGLAATWFASKVGDWWHDR